MKVTLITGASGGIGEAFARRLAAEKHDLVLVARTEKALHELCDELMLEHKITAHYVALDLTDSDADQRLFDETEKYGFEVDWLINNAGFGSYGDFSKLDLTRELRMIDLNIRSLTALTHRYLQGMRAARSGTIINVSSAAGFQPIPFMATYAATKTFVTSFSEAIAEENRPFGIQVLALCPGSTKTNFQAAANLEFPMHLKGQQTVDDVIDTAMRAVKSGRTKIVSGFTNYLVSLIVTIVPNALITRMLARAAAFEVSGRKMKFTVLGSGSTGNAVLISSEKTNVLVDAGMSAREILRRLAEVGVDHSQLDGILLTHEHSDHIGGLRVLLQTINCPVYVSRVTEDAYYNTRAGGENGDSESSKRRVALSDRTVEIESSREFRIGDIDFEPFSVPHDAVDNFGFVAKKEGVRVATLMDFGHISELIKEKLRGCDAIVVESNHSRDMLRACSVYTWELKQRIMSGTGHLSNEDLSDWLTNDFDGRARHIVLAHLSQRANDPALARITAEIALLMRAPLFKAETTISISHHKQPTEWISF